MLTLEEIVKELGRAFAEGDSKTIKDLKESYGEDASISSLFKDLVNGYEDEVIERAFPDLLKEVSNEGGEGEGEYANIVWEYIPTKQYIGFEGWYHSYEGYNWDDSNLEEFKAVPTVVYRSK